MSSINGSRPSAESDLSQPGLERGTVNVRGENSGTGFVVAPGLVLTCSHLLLGRKNQEAGVPFPKTCQIRFSPNTSETATIKASLPSKAEDLALLNVIVPETFKYLQLGSSDGCEWHNIETHGFPGREGFFGEPGVGRVIGRMKKLETRVELWRLETPNIIGGFSGAPVFDLLRQRVVGMIVQTLDANEQGLGSGALVLPSASIFAAFPQLKPSDIQPYLGLRSFGYDDSRFFFGRDKDIDRLFKLLLDFPRFVAVLGRSGSGKSSLVHAGIIPGLHRNPTTKDWRIKLFRGGSAELESSLDAHQALIGASKVGSIPHSLFVIDQFEEIFTEEIFTKDKERQNRLLQRLDSLIRSTPSTTVVIIMRSDFYDRLQESVGIGGLLDKNIFGITSRLSYDSIIEIITHPAKAVGYEIEEGLAERIADDAVGFEPLLGGNEKSAPLSVLPLLEFALELVFKQRVDGELVNRAYPTDGVTSMLVHYANERFAVLDERLQTRAKRIFTDLIHVGTEEQPLIARRPQPREKLWDNDKDREDVEYLIDMFTEARLLMTGEAPGTVEIIHESLIRTWHSLREWIQQRRDFLVWRSAVGPRIKRWLETQQADSLLNSGELAEIKKTFEDEMNADEREFVRRSQAAETIRVEFEKNRRIESESRELAAASFSQLFIDPELSVLLAQEAVRRKATSEAQEALLAALEESRIRLTIPHKGGSNQLAFDSTGVILASAGVDKTARLWLLAEQREIAVLNQHAEEVTCVKFEPNGHFIATGSIDGVVRIWDRGVEPPSLLRQFHAHTQGVRSLDFSPDGFRLVTGGEDAQVRVWNLSGIDEPIDLAGFERPVHCVAFSPDGESVAAGGADAHCRIWNIVAPERPIFTSPKFRDRVSAISFSADGRRIAVASFDGSAHIFQLQDDKKPPIICSASEKWLLGVAFDVEGDRIATCGEDCSTRIWDAHRGRLLTTLTGHKRGVTSVAFQGGAAIVATSSLDGTIRLWDVTDAGDYLTVTSDDRPLSAVGFDEEGRRLHTTSDRTVKIWDVETEQEKTSLKGSAAAFRPGGQQVAVVRSENILLVNLNPFRILKEFKGHTNTIIQVAFNPDGTQLASCGTDGTAILWNIDDETFNVLPGHKDWVNDVVYSPNGQLLATSSDDKTFMIWDTSTGERRDTFQGHRDWIQGLCFNREGTKVATASYDRTARLWDLARKEPTRVFEGHEDVVLDVDLCPRGRFLATASKDRSVRIWDLTSSDRKAVHVIRDHAEQVWGVAFNPNASTLISVSWDRTARIWDVEQGTEIAVLKSRRSPRRSVAYSPDGVAKMYRIELSELLEVANRRKLRSFTPWERQRFLHNEVPAV